jgi:hypothetical protein
VPSGLVSSSVATTPRGSRSLGHEIAQSGFEDEMALAATHRRRPLLGITTFNVGGDTTELFKASTLWRIGDGSLVLFWSDAWLDGQCIANMVPELIAVVSRQAHKNRRVASTLMDQTCIRDILGALTVPVLIQYTCSCSDGLRRWSYRSMSRNN